MSTSTIATLTAVAARLNDRVRTEVDARLFLIANFKAPLDTPPSFSGKYYQHVQTLYRFAIDCSYIISEASKKTFLPNNIIRNNPRLTHLYKFLPTSALGAINLLRTYADHTIAKENGFFDEETEKNYIQWISRVIRKERPQTEEDYEQLCYELERQATYLVTALDAFVNYVVGLPAVDREKTVEKWIEGTFGWYDSNMRRDWYLGQMANIYNSEVGNYFGTSRLNSANARETLENWFREYYGQEMVNRALRQETEPNRRKYCMINHFFAKDYKNNLKATLKNHPTLSMLPQDLMQQDIIDHLGDALEALLLDQ